MAEKNKNLPATIEEARKEIEALRGKSITVLGEDEVFNLMTAEGEVVAYKTAVNLSLDNGGLVKLGYKPQSPVTVSAQGYEMWAKKVNAMVMFPPAVLVGQQWMPNPYVVRDEGNKRVLFVYVRCVAMRYTPAGVPQVSDWTSYLDVQSYRMIDLLAKAKNTPEAFRLLPAGIEPAVDEKKGETWAKYPFDESTNLWVNTSHKDALQWFSNVINREKKALDIAQTFTKRNCLKHLSSIQAPPLDPTKSDGRQLANWTFPEVAWRRRDGGALTFDFAQYKNVKHLIGNAGSADDLATAMVDAPQIEYAESQAEAPAQSVSGRSDVAEEAEAVGAEPDYAETDAELVEEPEWEQTPPVDAYDEPSKPSSAAKTDKSTAAASSKTAKQYKQVLKMFPDTVEKAMGQLDISEGADPTEEQMVAIIKKTNQLLDEEGG